MRRRILNYQYVTWVFSLSLVAGYYNGASILIVSKTVSHMTGNLSHGVISLVQNNYADLIEYIIIAVSFFIGAVLGGWLFPQQYFKEKRRYGYIPIISAIFLAFIHYIHVDNMRILDYIAFILGLQNGMFVYYRGIIVRTTHMTGNITDAGLAFGRFLKGKKDELWKARFQFLNISSFSLGIALATILYLDSSLDLIYCGVVLQFLSGILYFILHTNIKASASILKESHGLPAFLHGSTHANHEKKEV